MRKPLSTVGTEVFAWQSNMIHMPVPNLAEAFTRLEAIFEMGHVSAFVFDKVFAAHFSCQGFTRSSMKREPGEVQ